MNRKCDFCGNENLIEGYVIDDGSTYFCSDICLHNRISEKDYLEMYDEGLAYWTQFDQEEDIE